jgi:hypothetical protein
MQNANITRRVSEKTIILNAAKNILLKGSSKEFFLQKVSVLEPIPGILASGFVLDLASNS